MSTDSLMSTDATVRGENLVPSLCSNLEPSPCVDITKMKPQKVMRNAQFGYAAENLPKVPRQAGFTIMIMTMVSRLNQNQPCSVKLRFIDHILRVQEHSGASVVLLR